MDDRKFSLADSEDVKFLFQMGLSLLLVGFCLFKLADDRTEKTALYWGGVMGIIGYWLPSPQGSAGGAVNTIADVIGKRLIGKESKGDDD